MPGSVLLAFVVIHGKIAFLGEELPLRPFLFNAAMLLSIVTTAVTVTAAPKPNSDDVKRKIKQCFDAEIQAFTPTRQFVGPTVNADCRPADLPFCRHNNDTQDMSYTTDPRWRIVGQPVIHPNSVNGGSFGGPVVDGARRRASAFAACHGTGCGGPGQWANGYLIGSEQRLPTDNEKKQVVGICFNRVVRGN